MNTVEAMQQGLQMLLNIFNIAALLYAFRLFLRKPRDTIETRIVELEVKVKEIDQSLHQGNDRFKAQENTNEIILHSILALIEFEIQYCLVENKPMSEELKKARADLNSFLSSRKGGIL